MRFYVHTMWAALFCLIIANPIEAASLIVIYGLAVDNDPQIGAAEATFKSRSEVVTQARSGLLPFLSVSGSTDDARRTIPLPITEIDTDPFSPTFGEPIVTGPSSDRPTQRFNSHSWQASLSQPVFRLDRWFQFQQSKSVRSQARAEFAAAQQDLIVRVGESYFAILEAQDLLTASKAEKDAVQRQLEQVQQRFDVGLVAITDVLESTAAFDSSAVNVIEAEGFQAISFESMLRLTGENLYEISSLSEDFPVEYPEPRDEQAWVDTALRQNYTLLAAQEGVKASRKQVQVARSGHYPTIDASVSYGHSASGGGGFFGSKVDQRTMRLSMTVPVYSGGLTHSRVKQGIYDMEAAEQNLELIQKTLVEQTRSLYTAINTDVGRVNARQKGIVSSQSALDATQTGYEVGTRNIVDVLLAQQRLYLAQFQYAQAKYKYITDTLKIKRLAGTLSPEDVTELNHFLINTSKVKKLTTVK